MTEQGLRVRDLMTSNVATFRAHDELILADDLMNLGRVRHVPVVAEDGRRIVGILSQRDLYRGALIRTLAAAENSENSVGLTVVIGDVMATEVKTVSADASLVSAGEIMLREKIGCLPVVGEGDEGLVGIITEADFVQYVVQEVVRRAQGA